MKILFISYLSQPSDRIGAVRPSNMVYWLAELGHEVTFITSNPRAAEVSGNAYVSSVGHSTLIQKGIQKLADRAQARKAAGVKPHGYHSAATSGGKSRIISKETFYSLRLWLWSWLCQQDWTICCLRYMKKYLRKEYDVVISCFGPLGSVYVGKWAKRKGYGKVWISDMRDPIDAIFYMSIVRGHLRKMEKTVLKKCDAMTVISNGLKEYFGSNAADEVQKNKIQVLENGFEYGELADCIEADDVLRIAYTGQLYPKMSNPRALLEAIYSLEKEGCVPQGKIQIHYAGPDSQKLLAMAKETATEHCVVDYGMLLRDKAVELQTKADILCVLSWNTEKDQGILTGKFWEYLRAKKTVLAVISGDVPEAELSCRIRDMKLGFSYEYAHNGADDVPLRQWLKANWKEKKDHGKLVFEPAEEKVLDYRYDNRAKRMADICRSVLISQST